VLGALLSNTVYYGHTDSNVHAWRDSLCPLGKLTCRSARLQGFLQVGKQTTNTPRCTRTRRDRTSTCGQTMCLCDKRKHELNHANGVDVCAPASWPAAVALWTALTNVLLHPPLRASPLLCEFADIPKNSNGTRHSFLLPQENNFPDMNLCLCSCPSQSQEGMEFRSAVVVASSSLCKESLLIPLASCNSEIPMSSNGKVPPSLAG